MAEMQRTFKAPFKFCPDCGGEFYFNEKIGKEYCGGCNTHSFKIFQRYYAFYSEIRREHFVDYHHGD